MIRPGRLPHLSLQLRTGVVHGRRGSSRGRSRAAARRDAIDAVGTPTGPERPRVRSTVRAGAGTGGARLLGARQRGQRLVGGYLFAGDAGAGRLGLAFDLLVRCRLGDDVLEELEIVIVRDGVGFSPPPTFLLV